VTDDTYTVYHTEDGLASTWLTAVAAAPDGGVWVGSWDSGVSFFDGETWTTYREADGLASNRVQSIAVAPDGTLWVGTRGNGIAVFDGESWTNYTKDDVLVANRVQGIAIAPDGTVWASARQIHSTGSSTGRGAIRFDGVKSRTIRVVPQVCWSRWSGWV
jgi:ligand-binding sensor domain-containing protein